MLDLMLVLNLPNLNLKNAGAINSPNIDIFSNILQNSKLLFFPQVRTQLGATIPNRNSSPCIKIMKKSSMASRLSWSFSIRNPGN
jgi:hypothetical protein